MDRGELDNGKRIGRVKATIDSFGERTTEGNLLKKPQTEFSERSSSRTRELHMAKRDVGRFNDSRRTAESIKARAESELFVAKKTVRDLASRIEESNLKTKASSTERGEEELPLAVRNVENSQDAEVMRELAYVKKEVSKLKLDMASVLDEKTRAEKVTEASSLKISCYLRSAEAIKKEIENVNEEQVLVELAQIEAVKEMRTIEAQRKEEADRFSSEMEKARKKMNEIFQEIEGSKETELKLAVTTFDISVLQNELKSAKEMDEKVQRNESFRQQEGSFQKGKELDSPMLATEELEAAKKELALIREEGFQLMASMDVIREELKHASQEVSRLKKKEEKTDFIVQNLNSKLLRAKAKLDAVSAAEEKAKTIVSNLSLTLKQLKKEAEAAKKERKLICEETTNLKVKVEKTESQIDSAGERLQDAMEELEAVKTSEATALDKLKTLTENTMRARASASQHSSTITISKFEYEYLTGRAVRAEEIANKKVAAAQAWVEALKVSEKEILIETEMSQRKVRELSVEEEQQTYKTRKSLSANRVVEGELRNRRENSEKKSESENEWLEGALPRKTMKENVNLTPARRARFRKSASPAIRHFARSGSVRRKRKVITNLAKLFNNKHVEGDH